MTNTLNQIIFFPPPISEYFFYDFILPGITSNVVSSGTAEVVVVETTH
jgi:hypothetical protein